MVPITSGTRTRPVSNAPSRSVRRSCSHFMFCRLNLDQLFEVVHRLLQVSYAAFAMPARHVLDDVPIKEPELPIDNGVPRLDALGRVVIAADLLIVRAHWLSRWIESRRNYHSGRRRSLRGMDACCRSRISCRCSSTAIPVHC